jgi:hypothetical protein
VSRQRIHHTDGMSHTAGWPLPLPYLSVRASVDGMSLQRALATASAGWCVRDEGVQNPVNARLPPGTAEDAVVTDALRMVALPPARGSPAGEPRLRTRASQRHSRSCRPPARRLTRFANCCADRPCAACRCIVDNWSLKTTGCRRGLTRLSLIRRPGTRSRRSWTGDRPRATTTRRCHISSGAWSPATCKADGVHVAGVTYWVLHTQPTAERTAETVIDSSSELTLN